MGRSMPREMSTDARRICTPGDNSDNIRIDPEFDSLIPPLSANELTDLHQSLDSEGCRDALVAWEGQNILLDGHNRIRYCREKGYPYPVIEKACADREQAKSYIILNQLSRRNLSPAAESYLRGKRYLEAKQQGARNDLTSGQTDQMTAAEQLGAEFKVGEKTIRRDSKFAQAVDEIAENCGPGARNVLLSRDTGLTRGRVQAVAKLNPAEQKKFIDAVRRTGTAPRKPQKQGKKKKRITIPTQPRALVETLVKQLAEQDLAEVSKGLAAAIKRLHKQDAPKVAANKPAKGKAKPTK